MPYYINKRYICPIIALTPQQRRQACLQSSARTISSSPCQGRSSLSSFPTIDGSLLRLLRVWEGRRERKRREMRGIPARRLRLLRARGVGA